MIRSLSRVLAVAIATGTAMGAMPVDAADLAILIANDDYQNQPPAASSARVLNLRRDFERAGFAVIGMRNMRAVHLDQADSTIVQRLRDADRVVVVVSGHVVHSDRDSWLLASDAGRPTALSVGRQGLSLGGLMALLAQRPGEAVLAVADPVQGRDLSDWLDSGFEAGDIPQGVTVIAGSQSQVADFIAHRLLRPGTVIADAAANPPQGFQVMGFLPRRMPFLPSDTGVVPNPGTSTAIDREAWTRARSLDTLAAYRNYLSLYPQGLFADEAQRRVAELSLTPQDRARLAEEALGLSRDRRRAIQGALDILGFDPGGVDGILGNRSRRAIADWQRVNGQPAYGFLSANQIAQLEQQAAVRAEELRLEAERRRIAEERADRDFWFQTGAGNTADGLRAYLQRYPDGLFSQQATAALAAIERENRRQAKVAERSAWDEAVMRGTLESYQGYLDVYPEGRFAEEARARITALSNPETPPDIVDAARAEEEQMNLSAFTRQLIEVQLRRVGLDPGPVDGSFTNETRRALRKYQRATGIDVTGYVTRPVVVRLLASAIQN